MSPFLGVFWNPYHLRKKCHTKPPFHKIGNWCKCICCINRLCVCKCPIRLVFYTSQLVRRISIPTSGILSVNSIAILHCADAVARANKRLRSYSSRSNWELEQPADYFLKVYGGKTRNLMNRQDQLPTSHWYIYEALSVSLMSTSSDAQQRKWGHMMSTSYFSSMHCAYFLDFRFETVLLLVRGALYYMLECSMIFVYIFMCSWDCIPSKHNLRCDSVLQMGATKWGVVLIFLMQDVKECTEKEWGCWSLNWSRDDDFGNESSWVMSHGDICSSTSKCKRSWLAFSVLPIVLTTKSFF